MTSVNNNKPEILTKLGIGSGINTTELIDTLVKAETEGIRESLDNKETEYNSQISAFSQIRNNLKVFNENLELIQRKNAMGYQGSSSDKTIATFTANGNSGAQSVNSSLTVSSLATAHTLTGPSLASPNATVGARTISIAFGTWSADPTQGGGQTHTANSLSSVSVTASSTTTLNQLRDMINSAVTDSDNDGQQDVTATVLYDGSNYMLSLKSQFGASNEMKITDNHASAPVYAYDTTDGAQLTQRVAGTNSSFTLDGISMSRSTNTIDDLYNGLTLQLFATTSSAITIKSEVDLESARTSIEDFVTTYNDVMVSLMELRQSDPNEDAGNLAGDTLLRSIMNEMRRSNSMEINGYEDGPYYLSNLGVKTMRDGTLSFADPSMLERTFKQNAESLRSFFKDQIISDNAAIAPKSYSIANTKPGSYAVSVSSGNVTVGGVSASGSGSTYTVPSGDPSGMVLEISSSNTSGTIHYGRSFISLLQQKLAQLAQKQANLEDRIASLYLRYQTQYSAMESTIAGLNETSSLLENAFKRNSD
jgi:flagellar hook-associated protein 2